MNNMNKIQSSVDIPTESYTIHIAGKEKNDAEDVVSINTHMTHLSLSTSPNMMDMMPVIQQNQIILTGENDGQQTSDQQVPQSLRQNTQGNFAGQTGSTTTEGGDPEPHNNCCHNKSSSVLDDIIRFMNDEDDDSALLEIYNLEEFYEDELWTKEQLTQAEQLLFAQKIKSLLNNAASKSASSSSSSSGHPLRKVLDLEYYSLTKLLERLQNDIEQSENIEIARTIMKEEEEEEEEEAKEDEQNNGAAAAAS